MTKGKHKTMLDIREIIHRLRAGHSDRRICREIGIDRTIIKRIIHSSSMVRDFIGHAK